LLFVWKCPKSSHAWFLFKDLALPQVTAEMFPNNGLKAAIPSVHCPAPHPALALTLEQTHCSLANRGLVSLSPAVVLGMSGSR
jgi:hypothetical protein